MVQTASSIIILAVILALIFVPARLDPAIRWKERNERRRSQDRRP